MSSFNEPFDSSYTPGQEMPSRYIWDSIEWDRYVPDLQEWNVLNRDGLGIDAVDGYEREVVESGNNAFNSERLPVFKHELEAYHDYQPLTIDPRVLCDTEDVTSNVPAPPSPLDSSSSTTLTQPAAPKMITLKPRKDPLCKLKVHHPDGTTSPCVKRVVGTKEAAEAHIRTYHPELVSKDKQTSRCAWPGCKGTVKRTRHIVDHYLYRKKCQECNRSFSARTDHNCLIPRSKTRIVTSRRKRAVEAEERAEEESADESLPEASTSKKNSRRGDYSDTERRTKRRKLTQ